MMHLEGRRFGMQVAVKLVVKIDQPSQCGLVNTDGASDRENVRDRAAKPQRSTTPNVPGVC